MKAIIQEEYGNPDVMKVADVERPQVGKDQVLVRVKASSINYNNMAFLYGKPFLIRAFTGMKRPKDKIPGGDFAGVIESAGSNVQGIKSGDRVYGDLSDAGWGALAEFTAAKPGTLSLIPDNISFEQAAAVPVSGLTALQGLRDVAKITKGQSVLINGASGNVGLFAVQLAKYFGAVVTAVCRGEKAEAVISAGADHVIDYSSQIFTLNGQTYDLIFDLAGNRPMRECMKSLKKGGIYLPCVYSPAALFFGPLRNLFSKKKVRSFLAKVTSDDLAFFNRLMDEGAVVPAIGKVYSLEEVKDAFWEYEKREIVGKIIINV